MITDLAIMKCNPVNKCKHMNGKFKSITFFKIFSKRVFVCTDCSELISIKEYKQRKLVLPIIDKGNFD